MFGKLMSISDELMWRYYALLTDLSRLRRARAARRGVGAARCIRSRRRRIWRRRSRRLPRRRTAARTAADEFERRFAKKELSLDELPALEWTLPDEPKAWRYLLVGLKLATSGGDADRKLTQGAVRLNGRKITDPQGLSARGAAAAASRMCCRSGGTRTAWWSGSAGIFTKMSARG